MDYLLHIDTSTDTGTVAICGDGAVLALRTNEEARNHAGAINLMIQGVLDEAGINFAQLGGIAVCAGPGSYTGLRIGMATAKGLCYVLGIPLLLDNRLTLLAYQAYSSHPGYDKYLALIVAREREYFINIYDGNFDCMVIPQHIVEDQLVEVAGNLENSYMITDALASEIYKSEVNNLVADNNIKIDVKWWAFYAFRKYKCNDSVNLASAEPFYLKQVYTHK